MERGEWTFPVLAGISDTPVLRADGTIHDVPGYDLASRMVFAPWCAWPAIKRAPTKEDAIAAYRELCDPFCDFPFAAPYYKAAAIVYTLTIIGRSAIGGSVPCRRRGLPHRARTRQARRGAALAGRRAVLVE